MIFQLLRKVKDRDKKMGSTADFIGDIKILLNALISKPPPDNAIESLSLMVQENAVKYPGDTALVCEDEIVTWLTLNERANRVARVLKDQGITKGDCVSLFMQNRIEFVVQVVAICKLGAIAGLINTNLNRQQLVHCINLVESKKCIFGEELTDSINEVRDELSLKDGEDYLFVNDSGDSPPPNWSISIDSCNSQIEAANHPETATVTIGSIAFYIFTSGTTGLPKAAIESHRRMFAGAKLSSDGLLRLKRFDRVYNCLPLYHGTSLIIGLAAAFNAGAATVIRRRLSVSAFWDDLRKYQCTCFVYIGEFIRYLMNQPPQKNDRDNLVRSIVGNGLRPDIWMAFKERFDIQRIGEFYAASEANGGFANVFNKDCTVGLSIAPVKIVQFDVATDEMVRDDQGHCIEVPEGDPGLLLIEVTAKSKYDGYTDKEASDRKIIQHVFVDNDMYFNTGDIMKTIDVGFAFGQTHYQFVDRVGDTFRWKSENVSTNEVGEIINGHEDVTFSNVYGVEIPGTDGRAGMAALVFRNGVDSGEIDLEGLSTHIIRNLPSYARPIFIRVLKNLPTTTTMKLQKNELREQAFHLDKVEQELLVLAPGSKIYRKLDSDFYDQILRREVAF